MNNLKLITTENFGDLSCNFYRNMNDDILLTREQIGQALEYSDPSKAIRKIHLKHKDRLDELCVRIKDKAFDSTQTGASREQNNNLITERVYYTERGIMEICRWSRQTKANIFMDWVWDIIESYRHNELNMSQNTQPLADAITTLTQTVVKLQEDVSSLKEFTSKKQTPEKKYSHWKTNTFKKLAIITQFANEHGQDLQLKDSIHITVKEFEDTYNIELSDYVQAYKSEFGMGNNPYVMNVIDHYKEIRDLYTMTLDGIMQKLNLQTENNTVTKNIFDTLAMELCQEENKGEWYYENTALETTYFDFYGDELIAVQDNATGEIYTSINAVLKGIGFKDRDQIRKRRDKWINDSLISKGIAKFTLPTQKMVTKNDTILFDEKDTYCISQRKLPIALAKINITPKMKQTQPELATKLELYQDKCADVLASVFIDKKSTNAINAEFLAESISNAITVALQPITERLEKIEQTQTNRYLSARRYPSPWYKKIAPKYKMLMEYFDCTRSELYSSIYKELEDTYDVDINQIHEDYCYENNLLKDECYPMDAIEHHTQLRDALTLLIDSSLIKYGLQTEEQIKNFKRKTLFDRPVIKQRITYVEDKI